MTDPIPVVFIGHAAVDVEGKLAMGDTFTIAGVRITGPGRFKICEPGEETLLVRSERSMFEIRG